MDLVFLLDQPESEWLDFKRGHHSETLTLLHDILCLANSWAESDRYLVFGVSDDGKVVGVEGEGNRRKESGIQDLLRQSDLNRIPTVSLRTEQASGHQIDVLTIRNRPDKPFVVVKDKRHGTNVLRAGVVYTRLGDTNTPLNETAPDEAIQLMWREHFGLGLSPLRRAFGLLEQPDKWQKVRGDEYLYHEDFPEFTIVHGEDIFEDFREPWSEKFPNSAASSFYVELRYGTTILRKYVFVVCDGGRYQFPLPDRNGDRFQVNVNSMAWRIAKLYRQYYLAETALNWVDVDLVTGPDDYD